METMKKLNISVIDYQDALSRYIDLAYRTLKRSDEKVPAQSRMRIPLTVMFIIHNRDVLGYTTVKEFEEVVKLDAEYIAKWNVGLDIKIIFKTIAQVLKGNGAR